MKPILCQKIFFHTIIVTNIFGTSFCYFHPFISIFPCEYNLFHFELNFISKEICFSYQVQRSSYPLKLFIRAQYLFHTLNIEFHTCTFVSHFNRSSLIVRTFINDPYGSSSFRMLLITLLHYWHQTHFHRVAKLDHVRVW